MDPSTDLPLKSHDLAPSEKHDSGDGGQGRRQGGESLRSEVHRSRSRVHRVVSQMLAITSPITYSSWTDTRGHAGSLKGCRMKHRRIQRPGIAFIFLMVLVGCSGRQVRQVAPDASVDVGELVSRTPLQSIRVAKIDSARVTLYRPDIRDGRLVGVRDAGPPTRIPLDSIAFVEAYVRGNRPGGRRGSPGEWVRLGILGGMFAAVGACIAGLCPTVVTGN